MDQGRNYRRLRNLRTDTSDLDRDECPVKVDTYQEIPPWTIIDWDVAFAADISKLPAAHIVTHFAQAFALMSSTEEERVSRVFEHVHNRVLLEQYVPDEEAKVF